MYDIKGKFDRALVSNIETDKKLMHIEFTDGRYATVTSEEPLDFNLNEVILVNVETGLIEKYHDQFWPDKSLVGKIISNGDELVIDTTRLVATIPNKNGESFESGALVKFKQNGDDLKKIADPQDEDIQVDSSLILKHKTKNEDLILGYKDFIGNDQVEYEAKQILTSNFLMREKLIKAGGHPVSGILFTGDPGVGKTTFAKIIAKECGAEYIHLSGTDILNPYYGQSEKYLREIFNLADKKQKTIIFIDELDSIASSRAGDIHEASKKIVNQLLVLMSEIDEKSNILLIGATNRPEDIDKALLRPGRFDSQIHFELPEVKDRIKLFKFFEKKYACIDNLPIDKLAIKCVGYSPADIEAIWNQALIFAFDCKREKILVEDLFAGWERVENNRNKKYRNI